MADYTLLTFDYDAFIVLFPLYSNSTTYPEATLTLYWTQATYYMSNIANYGDLQEDSRQYALNLLTAHITYINTQINSGQSPFIMTNAVIDKVNVSIVAPPTKNGWRFWLNTSPFGAQLIALLEANIVGGTYIAGYCRAFIDGNYWW